jgi:hypothetical protein
VTIKGSLNISLHFVSSKPKAKIFSPLWMNKTIKIENKPVFYEDWLRKGICFVNDIMSEDGKFLSIDLLETKFNISKTMKFNSIISAVKHAGK